jgi:hypothetical protein
MFYHPIEPPALIGLKDAGAAIVQRNVTKAHEGQKQEEVLANLEKKPGAPVG